MELGRGWGVGVEKDETQIYVIPVPLFLVGLFN